MYLDTKLNCKYAKQAHSFKILESQEIHRAIVEGRVDLHTID